VLNTNHQELRKIINEMVEAKYQTLVDANSMRQVPSPVESTWLTIAQLLKHLSISRQTMYNYIDEGLLTPHYLGKHVLFKREEVDAAPEPRLRPDGIRKSPRRSSSTPKKVKGGAAAC
jgi:excisionase family DNA binding protein